MKAIVQDRYGAQESLSLRDVDPPAAVGVSATTALQLLLHQGKVQGGQRYDFILDNVGNHSLSDTRRALTPDGRLQPNEGGHSSGRWIGSLGSIFKTALASLVVRQQLGPSVKFQNRADLIVLKGLLEVGKITPVIDSSWPLGGAPEALAHVAAGHAQGTVVITPHLSTERSPA